MRSTYGKTISASTREKERGSITAPFLILAVLLSSAALASLGHSILWKSKVALQLRLDECVEKISLELQKTQNLIESSNQRMRIERAAAIAAAIPSAGASLRAVKPILIIEQVLQEALRMKWRARQATWILRQGCDGKRDLFLPLPNLKWWRPPDDPLGPQALQWKEMKESGLDIRLWRSNRTSQSKVRKNENRWEANWTSLY